MTLFFVRGFFTLISMLVGYQIGALLGSPQSDSALIGLGIGAVVSIGIILVERGLRRISVRGLSSAVFGLIFGLLAAKLLTEAVMLLPVDEATARTMRVIFTLVLCYLGMIVAIRGRDEFNLIIPYVKFTRHDQVQQNIVLDTSVIIDGRIIDICQTKFIEGRLIIPRFVLKELQQIADSSDTLKRNRGRRGLDILNKIQKLDRVVVKIHDEDFPEISEVDAKLVKMAKVLDGKIFTNDYNLNKVAELEGVAVLNINELANALKPVVLPGEMMEVKIVKEGKEYNQGVAYLDDGTMVVVEEGRKLIGQTLEVLVTSVLQTSAGRMIFGRVDETYKQSGKPRNGKS
ncbi:MAG: TRAM domain-containing protein [Candidatus Omnitrophica bacterium]|nr:TRAM domain-containing protein [Candidatus Omnitrophota bacterium]MBU4479147.1 TRAM domain-containing protein [Candidatus Omnitrophota bacterium]MCG2702786.1 TRAM domain-containing protein [Candidatus Omnitrophota bacterium]